jgi:SAM-dependent methyltransferase
MVSSVYDKGREYKRKSPAMVSPEEKKAPANGSTSADHWERVYRTRAADALSWYQAEPMTSLRLIGHAAPDRDAALIDVGGGASTLIDELCAAGFRDLTLLDISTSALELVRLRLAAQAASVHWIESDVLHFEPGRRYDLWHDRALFHFMTEERERQAYLAVLNRAVAPGGQVILATFAADGPARCSGLPVQRYDAGRLLETLGPRFRLEEQASENHQTPAGATQRFAWFRLRRL